MAKQKFEVIEDYVNDFGTQVQDVIKTFKNKNDAFSYAEKLYNSERGSGVYVRTIIDGNYCLYNERTGEWESVV